MELWCLVVLVLAMVTGGSNGAPTGNTNQSGQELTAVAALMNNPSSEKNTSSDSNAVHAVAADGPVPQPLFLDLGKLKEWREKKEAPKKGNGRAKQPVPWTELDKLQKNSTDISSADFVPACFGCVLCEITNSC